VSANVQLSVIRSPIGQAMDEPRIAVIGEYDWLVPGEEPIEFVVAQAVGMFFGRLQCHEIHYVDHPHPQLREESTQNLYCRQGLEGGHVTRTRHHDVRFAT